MNYTPTPIFVQSTQGFSYLTEVGAWGLLNFGEKAFGSSKLEKVDVV